MKFSLMPVAAATLFLATVQSYTIDRESCAKHYDLVQEMVDGAWVRANAALVRAQADPHDADTERLLRNIFDAEGDEARRIVLERIERSTVNGNQDFGIFQFEEKKDIARDRYKVDLFRNDVVIFCNTDRYKRFSKDPEAKFGVLFDEVLEEAVGMTDGCGAAFAWTLPYRRYNVIQLCDWFLTYAANKKYKTITDLTSIKGNLAAAGADKLITKALYTPIDLIQLWDKVMYHEFFHTTAGKNAEDYGGFGGYGWKNVKKLAKKNKEQAANNADSHALVGAASWLMEEGYAVGDDGKITKME
ncbi:hypothetical protein AUEXF2481DRAFT_82981 [Aureobasidium subglaciale EXF-2481]|uniref:Lysine-specific metallo-endopeptidase domain-containing protein n=1 Tax=Aureobasidium subglaciale (strain EXF-2481) TaxID=1043005 RepID=A0A074Y1P3_AURSE|nr:uncharacterized protein AUEXF2481DRAFT_82981 [Aureobasidium subglaciale EXF-2481]KAI5194220.1 hypothetical protein E4T38_09653 [Aureobasidium subglaciale]KAI5213624.1 hypothetical protein E4T40_09595 [Aureobasidium subglaciale]KAI5215358.1 hypothetical protein E4T41_09633 [Aureobasidium subglaciale]KAI5253277.1 hypothetical protein E4T46_09610 [Aureobasidium subglaciale]KEQ91723.1 hypothetical protein AUEXF2481DRAFT_82981 [Aureobasidium subglaciale EXF-2481]